MAKEEFSVNAKEPVRDSEVQVDSPVDDSEVIVEKNINKEIEYEGPTAKEVLVNSVRVDKTAKKNYFGLFVLIIILICIGVVMSFELKSEDKKDNTIDYLKDVPKWSLAYNHYLKDSFKDIKEYELAFIDLDFDQSIEALVKYNSNDSTKYRIIDLFASEEMYFEYDNVNDLLLMYSFVDNTVKWYVNVSLDDDNLHLIDIEKRIDGDTNYELFFNSDTVADFKSSHVNLSYDIVFTEVYYRTLDKNFVEAINVHEEEKEIITSSSKSVVEQYKSLD